MSTASELRSIPGVGPATEADLLALGVRRRADLIGKDPEALYERLCALEGTRIDRCMLYVFRCAVYFAETPSPASELTRWWAWKDAADPPLHLLRSAGKARNGRKGHRA